MAPVLLTAPRPHRVLGLAALGGALAAAATVALGLSGSVWAYPVGALLSGLLALSGGVLLVGRARTSGDRARFQAVFGAGVVMWGAGQLMIAAGALAAPGSPQVSTAGDVVCTAAAPLALVGIAAFPRSRGPAGRRRRLAMDGVVLAVAATALLWFAAFQPVTGNAPDTVLAVAVLLADLGLLSVGLQVSLATLDRGVLVAACGFALFTLGDLVVTHDLVEAGGTWPWQAPAAACLGWPLISVGLLAVGSGPAGPRWLRGSTVEARTSAPTTVLVMALAGALAISALAHPAGLDAVSVGLSVALVVLLCARELVMQHQRLQLVRTLTDQAERDFLTGLGNRRALVDHLEELDHQGAGGAVVVVDLDGFKDVNDRIGHTAGDELLVEVARALVASAPRGWRCFRLGGDEFALVGASGASGTGGVDEATAATSAVLAAVGRAAVALDGVAQVVVSASAGVAVLPDGSTGDPLTGLSEASTAMQEAKRAGRDRVVVHSEDVAAAARRRVLIAHRLRAALAHDRLDAAMQPVVDIVTGRVVGFEVLSRWTDAELGTVRPDEFVAVAEQHGLVVELGVAVLGRGLAALRGIGGVERHLRISVNASPLELRTPGYVDRVLDALRSAGVPADLLVVEVTEAVYVTQDDPAVKTLEVLQAEGVRIAVDDFGTGYSSLSYLGRLPAHVVKIDRSLTAGLAETRTRAVVEALVRMGRALDLEVIAEGVEDAEQSAALTELGVRLGQGWLWSRAIAVTDVAELTRVIGPAPRGGSGAPSPELPAPRTSLKR